MLYRIKADHARYKMMTFSKQYMFKSMAASKSGGKEIVADRRPHVFGDDWEEVEVIFVDGYPEKRIEKAMPDIMLETSRLFFLKNPQNYSNMY